MMIGFIRTVRQQMRDQGYVKTDRIIFHPHSYGIATLMRLGFRFRGGRQIVLHHFKPHSEDEFHDHPWSFHTLVLWGGYIDESLLASGKVVRDVLGPGHFRSRSALHAHKTTATAKHTWTLVLMEPKEREWCKGTPESWVCGGEVADFDATRGMVKVK